MEIQKLEKHINLCKKNLRSQRVKCCLNCPFEEEITSAFPDMKKLWENRRKLNGEIA